SATASVRFTGDSELNGLTGSTISSTATSRMAFSTTASYSFPTPSKTLTRSPCFKRSTSRRCRASSPASDTRWLRRSNASGGAKNLRRDIVTIYVGLNDQSCPLSIFHRLRLGGDTQLEQSLPNAINLFPKNSRQNKATTSHVYQLGKNGNNYVCSKIRTDKIS